VVLNVECADNLNESFFSESSITCVAPGNETPR